MNTTLRRPIAPKLAELDFRIRALPGVPLDDLENEARSIIDDLTELPAIDAAPLWARFAGSLLDVVLGD